MNKVFGFIIKEFKDWWNKKSKIYKWGLKFILLPLIVLSLILLSIIGIFELNKQEIQNPVAQVVQNSVPYDNFLNHFDRINKNTIVGCWDLELLEYRDNSIFVCFNSDSTIEWGESLDKIIFTGTWYTVKDSLYFTLWVEKYQGTWEFVGDFLTLYFIESTWQKTLNTMSGTRNK